MIISSKDIGRWKVGQSLKMRSFEIGFLELRVNGLHSECAVVNASGTIRIEPNPMIALKR